MSKSAVPPLNKKTGGSSIIPEKYQDLFYCLILLVSVFIFLAPGIFGGYFNSTDILASQSFETYLEKSKESGEFPLWVPYIFGGMPSYAALLTTGERWWDFGWFFLFRFLHGIGQVFSNDSARIALYYVIYGIGMYMLMRSKKMERFVSFFTAFAAVFSTTIITWVMIGHNTKPITMALIPFAILLLEKLREKFSLLYSALLILVIHLIFETTHVQMMFYAFTAIGLYLLFELVSRLISRQQPLGVLRAGLILVIATGFAYLQSADRYWSVNEYTPYSTRGSAPIVKTGGKSVDETGGNPYDYATMWSFSPQETMDFLVPNFHGFGKLPVDPDNNDPDAAQVVQVAQANNITKLPTYWSQKPFEDCAPYMGIIVLVLALFGAVMYIRNVFVQFLVVLSLFALLLSFGYTWPLLYDFFFYNVPAFNKFRAPSMALVLAQFAIPVLAGFGLSGLMKLRGDKEARALKTRRALLVVAVLFLAWGVLYSALFKSSYIDSVAHSKNITAAYGKDLSLPVANFIWSEMISDWYMTAFILLAGSVLIFMYSSGRLSRAMLYGGLALLLVVDLWRVGYRSMDAKDTKITDEVFTRYDFVDFIKQDKSLYRVAPVNAFASPDAPAYYGLQSVSGYHSAKMRIYQDMLDVTSGGSTSDMINPFMWDLMNVKYVIDKRDLGIQPVYVSQQTGLKVYLNQGITAGRGYLPRAFFVDSVVKAEPLAILKKMKWTGNPADNFNPRKVAYIEKDLGRNITPPDSTASVKVLQYRNHLVKMEAKASGDNFLFASEIYYPAGWKAYIDGNETEIVKTNYGFRGIVVPAGTHVVEFRFRSERFESGRIASMASNGLLVLLLVGGYFWEKKRKKNLVSEPAIEQ